MKTSRFALTTAYTRSDWPAFRLHLREVPDPPGSIRDGARLKSWVRGIGPIETSDIMHVEAAIWDLLESNADSLNGDRRWIALDGPPLAGKTLTAVVAMLRINAELLQTDTGVYPAGVIAEHIPVVCVSGWIGRNANLLTLLQKIARFCGLPHGPRLKEDDLLHQLRETLPVLGTRLIVVDDGHFLRRVNRSRGLTDALKEMITSLPATFVFVGAGITTSALLDARTDPGGYSASLQLERRMVYRKMHVTSRENDSEMIAWRGRMTTMMNQFDRVDGMDTAVLRQDRTLERLFVRAGGLTGMSLLLLKDIVALAVMEGKSPTGRHVTAVIGPR